MAGLDPAIHGVKLPPASTRMLHSQGMRHRLDARVEPGHDGCRDDAVARQRQKAVVKGQSPGFVSRQLRGRAVATYCETGPQWMGSARRANRYRRHEGGRDKLGREQGGRLT
jgi:hypothetical protein